jgi:hypothetical protein
VLYRNLAQTALYPIVSIQNLDASENKSKKKKEKVYTATHKGKKGDNQNGRETRNPKERFRMKPSRCWRGEFLNICRDSRFKKTSRKKKKKKNCIINLRHPQ